MALTRSHSPLLDEEGATIVMTNSPEGDDSSASSNLQAAFNDDHNDDYCSSCGGVGVLLCCDGPTCRRSFHLYCLDPPLTRIPDGDWFCPFCSSVRHALEGNVHGSGSSRNSNALDGPRRQRSLKRERSSGRHDDESKRRLQESAPILPKKTRKRASREVGEVPGRKRARSTAVMENAESEESSNDRIRCTVFGDVLDGKGDNVYRSNVSYLDVCRICKEWEDEHDGPRQGGVSTSSFSGVGWIGRGWTDSSLGGAARARSSEMGVGSDSSLQKSGSKIGGGAEFSDACSSESWESEDDGTHSDDEGRRCIFDRGKDLLAGKYRQLFEEDPERGQSLGGGGNASTVEILSATDGTFAVDLREERSVLFERSVAQFPLWWTEMCAGFNICMYGYGSKQPVLRRFATRYLSGLRVIEIQGFSPSLSLRRVLGVVHAEAMKLVREEDKKELSALGRTPMEQVTCIRKAMGCVTISTMDGMRGPQFDKSMVIIFHSIDGPVLRSRAAQEALAALANIPNIYFIATVDHLNATLLWDDSVRSLFSFVFHDSPSFLPYSTESVVLGLGSFSGSGHVTEQSALAVLQSLPIKAQQVFFLLLKRQHEVEKAHDSSRGESLTVELARFTEVELFEAAREAFLVASQRNMHHVLSEFRDHQLILSNRRRVGSGVSRDEMFVPLDSGSAERILKKLSILFDESG